MKVIRDNLATIVVGIVVATCLVAAFVLLGPWQTGSSGELVAVVHDAEGNETRLPLSQDTVIEIQTSRGRNVVAVKDGTVFMKEADCPKGSCLHQSPISQPGEQIICLPHELWIEVVQNRGMGGNATGADKNPEVDLVAQ